MKDYILNVFQMSVENNLHRIHTLVSHGGTCRSDKTITQSPHKIAATDPYLDLRSSLFISRISQWSQWMSLLFCGFLPNPLSTTYSVDVPATNL